MQERKKPDNDGAYRFLQNSESSEQNLFYVINLAPRICTRLLDF